MEFFAETDSTYGARLIWVLKEKNKDREGLVFIKNMKYDPAGKQRIADYMYSPDHNMTAKGFLSITDGVLTVKGRKFGISGTEHFTRK